MTKCQKLRMGPQNMEQLDFLPVSVKQTQWLALRLVKYTSVKLIRGSIVTWDRFKFL